MNMMNKLLLAAVVSGVLTGCITSKEIIVGRDENGNEIPLMRGKTMIILMDYNKGIRRVSYE